MKIVLFLLLITYIFTVDATTATLDLTQGQSLTVGTAGTVKITVIANGDMTLKSLTNLVLKKNEDTTTIELTCTFDEAYSFAEEALTKEVTCSTNAPQSAGTYKLAAAASATIGGTSDGTNSLDSVTFSIANEPNSLSITQTVVEEDPCNGKEQTACTGTCTWNSATSKCVTADVQEDPCNGKEQTACTGTCTWNSATSKCVTADVQEDPCNGKEQTACTGTCTWNSATSKCVTADVQEDPCDGKAQTACTGTCTWNSATSKCVTADVQEDPCNGKAQTACTGTCTWNSATSKCVTADVQEDPCDGKEQTACTGTCTWNSATSKCVTAGSDTGSNSGSSTNQGSGSGTDEGSGSDSSGFLKLSVFICLFVLFL